MKSMISWVMEPRSAPLSFDQTLAHSMVAAYLGESAEVDGLGRFSSDNVHITVDRAGAIRVTSCATIDDQGILRGLEMAKNLFQLIRPLLPHQTTPVPHLILGQTANHMRDGSSSSDVEHLVPDLSVESARHTRFGHVYSFAPIAGRA